MPARTGCLWDGPKNTQYRRSSVSLSVPRENRVKNWKEGDAGGRLNPPVAPSRFCRFLRIFAGRLGRSGEDRGQRNKVPKSPFCTPKKKLPGANTRPSVGRRELRRGGAGTPLNHRTGSSMYLGERPGSSGVPAAPRRRARAACGWAKKGTLKAQFSVPQCP